MRACGSVHAERHFHDFLLRLSTSVVQWPCWPCQLFWAIDSLLRQTFRFCGPPLMSTPSCFRRASIWRRTSGGMFLKCSLMSGMGLPSGMRMSFCTCHRPGLMGGASCACALRQAVISSGSTTRTRMEFSG